MTEPQPRRTMPVSPHRSGRVMSQHACEALGQAAWFAAELQLPQAPPPAEPQGPQAAPQQNHVVSPAQSGVVEQATGELPFAFVRNGTLAI
jgi:hypothetical protein